jgi:hypothetical protein
MCECVAFLDRRLDWQLRWQAQLSLLCAVCIVYLVSDRVRPGVQFMASDIDRAWIHD